jgi:hypothetical protein
MTKKLRYSDVIGRYFYQISLSDEDKDLVDTFFTGSAHHLKRFKEATQPEDRDYHLSRHRSHLRKMMLVVFKRGDFSKAVDPSNRDLDRRDTWNPDWTTMPDPNMFNKMLPDWRYGIGEAHCADYYLREDELLIAKCS